MKVYNVTIAGTVQEREAVSESSHTYTFGDGTRVHKRTEHHAWCPTLADAYRVRLASERVKADNVRGHLAALDARVADLRAKLAEVEG